MNRDDIPELHYIAPLENLASIAEHGILSHARAAKVAHQSVALEEVQLIRAEKWVPRGQRLHEYVNLYFDARNAMMYTVRSRGPVVVRVSPEVLDLPGTVVADGNAANSPTRFHSAPEGLDALDEERVYARSWDHGDPWVKRELRRQRQAEVLVLDLVPASAILGCYVRFPGTKVQCQVQVPEWIVEVNHRVYFDD